MRIAVSLLLVAGCDYTFNLDHLDPGAPDAPQPDAFDVATQCRSDYDLPLWPGSRFRIYTSPGAAWALSDACNDDNADGTAHLAVAQTREKLDALIGALTVRQGVRWWIGAVQPASATTPLEKWLWVTGEPVDPSLWDMPTEPNDGDGSESDHNDQFGFIEQTSPGLVDVNGSLMMNGLCECDGHTMAAAAVAAIAQNRP